MNFAKWINKESSDPFCAEIGTDPYLDFVHVQIAKADIRRSRGRIGRCPVRMDAGRARLIFAKLYVFVVRNELHVLGKIIGTVLGR